MSRLNATAMSDNLRAEKEEVKTIRIGHSPDPDDAFMFHGMKSWT